MNTHQDRKDYFLKYRKKNRLKRNKQRREYYERTKYKTREKDKASSKEYYHNNIEKLRLKNKDKRSHSIENISLEYIIEKLKRRDPLLTTKEIKSHPELIENERLYIQYCRINKNDKNGN